MNCIANESASPTGDHRNVQPEYGISKREHFASMAMQGLLGNKNITPNLSTIANDAVSLADALIDALNK